MSFKRVCLFTLLVLNVSSSLAHDLFPNGQVEFRSLRSEPLVSEEWFARGESCRHRVGERFFGRAGKYNNAHSSKSQRYGLERRQLGQALFVRLTDRSGLAGK